MVDWQQKLTNYISVYLLCSKKFVRNILLLSCGELVGLFICASYIARSAPGLGQLQHPLAFSGTSHIFQLQLHLGSPHSANRARQGSSVSKQFIGAPGLGVHGEPQACLEEPLEKMGRWYVDGPIRILSVRQPLISSGPLVFAAPTIVCLFFSQNIMWY